MYETLLSGPTFHKLFSSLSISITLFSHSETHTYKSELFPFPLTKCNFIPHTFCNNKTYILFSLRNQELTFMLAFYRLVNICTSEYILKNFFCFLIENISGWHQTLFMNSPKSLVSL